MKSITINGSKRESVGKVATKALRNAGEVPCVLYGGEAPVHFAADERAFAKLVYTPNAHTVVIDLGDNGTFNAILQDIQFHVLFSPVLLGIVAGLCVGKPLGITLFAYLGNVLGWASLPEELSWMDIIAVAFICGVGFTMSLFIGELAFEHYEVSMYPVWVKSGVLLGSLISCIFGYCILKFSLRNQQVSV